MERVINYGLNKNFVSICGILLMQKSCEFFLVGGLEYIRSSNHPVFVRAEKSLVLQGSKNQWFRQAVNKVKGAKVLIYYSVPLAMCPFYASDLGDQNSVTPTCRSNAASSSEWFFSNKQLYDEMRSAASLIQNSCFNAPCQFLSPAHLTFLLGLSGFRDWPTQLRPLESQTDLIPTPLFIPKTHVHTCTNMNTYYMPYWKQSIHKSPQNKIKAISPTQDIVYMLGQLYSNLFIPPSSQPMRRFFFF